MIRRFNQFIPKMKGTAPQWIFAAKFQDAHFTFDDLKKSVKAICNKSD